jgi:hypothetical protein
MEGIAGWGFKGAAIKRDVRMKAFFIRVWNNGEVRTFWATSWKQVTKLPVIDRSVAEYRLKLPHPSPDLLVAIVVNKHPGLD